MTPFTAAMRRPQILRNALKVSLVVGTLLNLINQGERLLAGDGLLWGYAFMNYLVPFCVAAYSGVRALQVRNGEVSDATDGEKIHVRQP